MKKNLKTLLVTACVGATLAGCAPIVYVRGNLVTTEDTQKIKSGSTSKDEVLSLLGTPSTVATFSPNVWMYIGTRTERFAFLKPETVEHKTFLVEFDDQETVVDTALLDQSALRKIDLSKDFTPTAGQGITVIQQLLGNVGRFKGQPGK